MGGESTARRWGPQISELATAQHGVVARRQLTALGMGAGAIDGRVARGLLHSLHRGVYAVGHRSTTQQGRWLAAVLACGPEALLSHRSAAMLWGLTSTYAGPLEVTSPGARATRRPGIVAHASVVAGGERAAVDAIPVTSPFRTLLDLASILNPRQLERAVHEAEVHELRDRVSLPNLLGRHPRRRGASRLRRVLEAKAPVSVTRNEFEEAFVALLDRHGLPRPRFNAKLAIRGRFVEPDCMWPEQRLLVELDGGAVHRTERNFHGDRQRDRVLLVEGWRSARVTWDQLRDEPAAIAADLRELLRAGRSAPTL